MTTMFQDKVKCAVCGESNPLRIVSSTNAFRTIDLDIQRCPSCGYCSQELSELMKGADEHIDSDEYRAQLTNEKFPELANIILCAGLLHEFTEEYNMAGGDCLHAALVCDKEENDLAATYCRKRAYSMFIEAMDSGQKFMDSPSKERLLLSDIARRAGHALSIVAFLV